MRAPSLILSGLLAGLAAASPALADIKDVRVEESGASGRIWLAFDEQPAAADLVLEPGAARLSVRGVQVRPRAIETVRREALNVHATAGGAEIVLPARTDWREARAEIREGGVLITYQGAYESAAPATPEARILPASAMTSAMTSTVSAPAPAAEAAAPEPRPEPRPAPEPAPEIAPEPAAVERPAVSPEMTPEGAAEPAPETLPETAPETAPETSPERAPEPAPVAAADTVAPQPARAMTPCEIAAAGVAADPWNFAVLGDHAACLADQDETEAAREIYERILAFEPENYTAALGLAQISVDQGDAEAARALFSQAASAASSDAEAAYAWSRARDLPGQ